MLDGLAGDPVASRRRARRTRRPCRRAVPPARRGCPSPRGGHRLLLSCSMRPRASVLQVTPVRAHLDREVAGEGDPAALARRCTASIADVRRRLLPAPDEIVMTRPHPRSHIPSMTALAQLQDAVEVDDPIGACQSSGVHLAERRGRIAARVRVAGVVHEDVDRTDRLLDARRRRRHGPRSVTSKAAATAVPSADVTRACSSARSAHDVVHRDRRAAWRRACGRCRRRRSGRRR